MATTSDQGEGAGQADDVGGERGHPAFPQDRHENHVTPSDDCIACWDERREEAYIKERLIWRAYGEAVDARRKIEEARLKALARKKTP